MGDSRDYIDLESVPHDAVLKTCCNKTLDQFNEDAYRLVCFFVDQKWTFSYSSMLMTVATEFMDKTMRSETIQKDSTDDKK